MTAKNLYFVAIIPPSDVCAEVLAIQRDFAARFQSSRSLKVIPHITLKAPFGYPANCHEDVLNWFNALKINVSEFFIELRNFGCFPNSKSPVIFIEPVPSHLLLTLQKKAMRQFVDSFPSEPVMELEIKFTPHLTVAYRDLNPHFFVSAWEEYSEKKFFAMFQVNEIYLLQHDGVRWNKISSVHVNE